MLVARLTEIAGVFPAVIAIALVHALTQRPSVCRWQRSSQSSAPRTPHAWCEFLRCQNRSGVEFDTLALKEEHISLVARLFVIDCHI
jgi:hypothetical protein